MQSSELKMNTIRSLTWLKFPFQYIDDPRVKKELKAYELELARKTIEELITLLYQERERVSQEVLLEAKLKDRILFFNFPNAEADFEEWSKAPSWTFDEAIALLLGKNPRVVNWEKVKKHLPTSPFAIEYEKVREFVLRARNLGQLFEPVLPSVFLAWAKDRNIVELPFELVKAVEVNGNIIVDWQDLCQQQKIENEELVKNIKEHNDKSHDSFSSKDIENLKILLQKSVKENPRSHAALLNIVGASIQMMLEVGKGNIPPHHLQSKEGIYCRLLERNPNKKGVKDRTIEKKLSELKKLPAWFAEMVDEALNSLENS